MFYAQHLVRLYRASIAYSIYCRFASRRYGGTSTVRQLPYACDVQYSTRHHYRLYSGVAAPATTTRSIAVSCESRSVGVSAGVAKLAAKTIAVFRRGEAGSFAWRTVRAVKAYLQETPHAFIELLPALRCTR